LEQGNLENGKVRMGFGGVEQEEITEWGKERNETDFFLLFIWNERSRVKV